MGRREAAELDRYLTRGDHAAECPRTCEACGWCEHYPCADGAKDVPDGAAYAVAGMGEDVRDGLCRICREDVEANRA